MNGKIKYRLLKCFSLALIFGFLISCGSSPGAASSGSSSTSSVSSSSSQQLSDAQSRQNLYLRHIQNEGYVTNIENGNITFEREGFTYYVIINRDDPSFTMIYLPYILGLSSDSERIMAAVAVSDANSSTKVAKAYIDGQNDQYVSIAVEIFLENPNDFTVLFDRFLSAIRSSVSAFGASIEYFSSSM